MALAGPQRRAELRHLVAEMAPLVEGDEYRPADYERNVALDRRFHQLIVETAENPYLVGMYRRLSMLVHIVDFQSRRGLRRASQGLEEHRAIAEAYAREDADAGVRYPDPAHRAQPERRPAGDGQAGGRPLAPALAPATASPARGRHHPVWGGRITLMPMKIADVTAQRFRYQSEKVRDSEGHTHPGDPHEATETLVTIKTDGGAEGYCFGASPEVIRNLVRPLILGEDPYDREKIWRHLNEMQRGNRATLTDRVIGVVDQALWDLAGRAQGLPAHKLLGGFREKVKPTPARCAATSSRAAWNSPEDYAEFALKCEAQGYKAFKIHTRMPPIPAPNLEGDIATCAAVREAVGPDMALMLDRHHHYSREEAFYLGRRAGEAGLRLDGGADGRALHLLLRLAERQPEEAANLRPGDRRGSVLHPRRVDRARCGRPLAGRHQRCGRHHPGDEDGPPLRGVPHALRGPQRRRGQPAVPRRDGHPRARCTRRGCCTPSWTTRRRRPG